MIVYSFMPDYVNDFSDLLYGSIRLWLLEESRHRMNYGLESPRSGRQLKRLTTAVARFAGS